MGQVPPRRVSNYNYLFWINSKLLKSLSDNPTVYLKAVTKWDGEWIFWGKTIVHRKYNNVIILHHISPLSCVIRMLEATHAHKSPTVKMQNNFFYSVL